MYLRVLGKKLIVEGSVDINVEKIFCMDFEYFFKICFICEDNFGF